SAPCRLSASRPAYDAEKLARIDFCGRQGLEYPSSAMRTQRGSLKDHDLWSAVRFGGGLQRRTGMERRCSAIAEIETAHRLNGSSELSRSSSGGLTHHGRACLISIA